MTEKHYVTILLNEEFFMDSMIVTGGAGFIGANFVRYVLENTEYQIIVLDKLTYAGNRISLKAHEENSRFVFIEADIADRESNQKIFDEYKPIAVVNFAAETHVDRSIDDPEPFVRTNFLGTYELLQASLKIYHEMSEADQERFRFLHVSTDEVYGSLGETGEFEEDNPYKPNSPYSASKAGADHLVRAWNKTYGLPALVTNCSNNYGPLQFPEKLIPLVLLNLCEAKDIPIYGDGKNVRDWLYVDDHCSGILSVLQGGRLGEKYNIGGGNEMENIQMVDLICEILESIHPAVDNVKMKERGVSDYKELKTFVKDRPGHDRRYAINATKIREELGWTTKFDPRKGLESTVRWYLSNLDWCEAVTENSYDRERLGLG